MLWQLQVSDKITQDREQRSRRFRDFAPAWVPNFTSPFPAKYGVVGWYTSSMEAHELLKKALALPDHERAELASTLLESLDTTVDEDADAAWQKEIARRLDEVRSGRVKTVPWSKVREKGRKLLYGK